MTRIISANLNGIRSANTKGFLIGRRNNPPILSACRNSKRRRTWEAHFAEFAGLRGYFQYAEKKGYSGVGLSTPSSADEVIIGFDGGGEFDREGRYVEARFGKLSVMSVYFPSGSSAPERQEAKYRFLALFYPHIQALRAAGREIIICSDVNIAHHELDLKNWKAI